MKNPLTNAQRWLSQAEYDLAQAEKSLTSSSFSYAAFFSEQAAQKALKAFLFKSGERTVTIHSVAELLKKAALAEPSFDVLIPKGAKLDRHYLASRYPDALPEPAVPHESYSKDDSEEALAIAREILAAVKKFL